MSGPQSDIDKNARRVAEQHEEHERVIDDEEGAYAELLQAILYSAVPAHPAISSAIPGHDDLRGVQLVRTDEGTIWWIENDERLVELVHITPNGTVTPSLLSDIPEQYGRSAVVDAIMKLSVAIDAQIRGNKRSATEKIRRRADQIRALAVVVRGLS